MISFPLVINKHIHMQLLTVSWHLFKLESQNYGPVLINTQSRLRFHCCLFLHTLKENPIKTFILNCNPLLKKNWSISFLGDAWDLVVSGKYKLRNVT